MTLAKPAQFAVHWEVSEINNFQISPLRKVQIFYCSAQEKTTNGSASLALLGTTQLHSVPACRRCVVCSPMTLLSLHSFYSNSERFRISLKRSQYIFTITCLPTSLGMLLFSFAPQQHLPESTYSFFVYTMHTKRCLCCLHRKCWVKKTKRFTLSKGYYKSHLILGVL